MDRLRTKATLKQSARLFWNRPALFRLVGILLLWSATDGAFAAGAIRWWGELGYNFRYQDFEDGEDLSEHIPILRLHGSSYLYRPWVATVQGSLMVQAIRSKTDTMKSDTDALGGDVLVRLFPQSRFPLELYGEKMNSDTDSDLSDLTLERTRYGIHQRFVAVGGTTFRLRYEHSDLVNVNDNHTGTERRNDLTDFFEASAQSSFGKHSMSFNSSVNRIDTLDSPRRSETSFSALRHTYRPSARLNSEDLLTYNTIRREDELTSIDTNTLQLSSFAFWRPAFNDSWRVNANLRAVSSGSGPIGDRKVRSQGASGSLFANYEINQEWLLTAGFGGSGLKFDDSNEYISFQSMRAIYNSRFREFLGFEYGFFGRGEVSNDTSEVGDIQSLDALIGYRLERTWEIVGGMLRGTFRQSVGQVADTADFSVGRLETNGSVGWTRQAGNRSAIVRFSINDTRIESQGADIRNVEGNFQLVNAQLSLNQRFSSGTALIGNLTLQAMRQYREDLAELASSENGEWRPTATADLTFSMQSLFGIRRLRFRSTLRFISDAFVPLMKPDRFNGRNNKYWENRLEYNLGRMEVRLIGRLNRIRGSQQLLTLLQIRRLIGEA